MKDRKKCLLAVALISSLTFSFIVAASASDPKSKPSRYREFTKICRDAQGEANLGMCLGEKAIEVERNLQELEQKVRSSLETNERELFDKTSEAWFRFVNLSCRYDTQSLGSMAGSVAGRCTIRLHLLRIEALEKYQACLSLDDCGRPILLYMMMTPDN
jgi:uncharacterized protein YecT (DUF1311 family)